MSFELAHRQTLTELVRLFEVAERDIHTGFELVAGAVKRLETELSGYFTIGHGVNFEDPERHIDKLRRIAWVALLERIEVRKLMSVAKWEGLMSDIKRGDECPAMTVENVLAMCAQFEREMPDMIQAAVHEVFDWLVPHEHSYSRRYKRNDKRKVGERVVITYVFDRDWSHWHVCERAEQYLIALDNVFSMLDGKGQVNKASHFSELHTVAKGTNGKHPLEGETPYYFFKGYKNGNLHLRFKRMELVQKMNAFAGKGRLTEPE